MGEVTETCQAPLTRARAWGAATNPTQGGLGACFESEVTWVLSCGQLGPGYNFYSWVFSSDTKYGVACV